VLGLDPTHETDLMRILERVGFVPQCSSLYGWATPAELVRMNKAYFPRWSDEAAAQPGAAAGNPHEDGVQETLRWESEQGGAAPSAGAGGGSIDSGRAHLPALIP